MNREEFIANIRYLGWICFQMGAKLPLHDVGEDYEISKERLDSLIDGTKWTLAHPEATAEDNHVHWMKFKREQGYKYGEILDTINKTHPSMVNFEDLPDVEKRKDEMDLIMTRLANKLFDKQGE